MLSQVAAVKLFSPFYIHLRMNALRFKVTRFHIKDFSGRRRQSKAGTDNYKLSHPLIIHELAYTVPHSIRKSPSSTLPLINIHEDSLLSSNLAKSCVNNCISLLSVVLSPSSPAAAGGYWCENVVMHAWDWDKCLVSTILVNQENKH